MGGWICLAGWWWPWESHCVQQQQHIIALTKAGNPDWEQTKPPRLLGACWTAEVNYSNSDMDSNSREEQRQQLRTRRHLQGRDLDSRAPTAFLSALFGWTDDVFKVRNWRLSWFSFNLFSVTCHLFLIRVTGQLGGAIESLILIISSERKDPQRWIWYYKLNKVKATYQLDWNLIKIKAPSFEFINFISCLCEQSLGLWLETA